jgi:hypothetical protein
MLAETLKLILTFTDVSVSVSVDDVSAYVNKCVQFRGVQFRYHCSCQQMRGISIFLIRIFFHTKTFIEIEYVWLPITDNVE